jgi:hypothetical protein
MALQSQSFQLPLNKGVDTKTDPKLVTDGMLNVVNGVFRDTGGKAGQRLNMRYGYNNLGANLVASTGTTTLTSGEALGSFNKELLMFDQTTLYSRSDASNAYVSKGNSVPLLVSSQSILQNARTQTKCDAAELNNITVYAWVDSSGGVRASVFDSLSGNTYQSDVAINANGANPKVIALGASYIGIFYEETTTHIIKFKRLNLTNPFTFLTEQGLVTSASTASPWFDLCVSGQYALWVAHKADNTIDIGYVDQDGSVSAAGIPTKVNLAETATNCLGCFVEPSNRNIYVMFHNNTNGTRVVGYTFSLGSPSFAVATIDATTTPITKNITAITIDSNSVRIFYEVNDATTTKHYVKVATVTAVGVVSSVAVIVRSVGLTSKAFTLASHQYVGMIHDSPIQATYFVADESGKLVGKMLPGVAGVQAQSHLSQIIEIDSDTVALAVLKKVQFTSNGSDFFSTTGISRVTLDFGSTDKYFSTQLGNNLLINGGFVNAYDGTSIIEHGFHLWPESISLGSTSASGGNLSNGAYSVAAVYSWTDNYGQVHRSAPSPYASITLSGGGSTQQFTVTVPTLRLTSKTAPRAEVVVEIYRTTVGGSIHYLVASSTAGQNPLFNNPAADTVAFVIDSNATTDANLISQPILYIESGEVENIAPPPSHYIVHTKNRVFLNNSEDPNEFWYSKQFIPGVGVGFSDLFKIRLDPLGGDPVGLFPMDDKVIFFKGSKIYAISGDGPTDTGEQNTFSDPQLISSDLGLRDTNSIVLTPKGLMFQSSKGKYLLDRGLNLTYIGAPVEAYDSYTVTSADLIEAQNQVRFLTTGPCLIYDTFYEQWTTFDNHEGKDAIRWNGDYVYLRSSLGHVYKETADYYLDDNRTITLQAETPWIKVGSVQNYQRVRRLHVIGDYFSEHQLQVDMAYDYFNAYPDTLTWSPATAAIVSGTFGTGTYGSEPVFGGVADNVYQARFHIPRQKCQAIKFRISNIQPASSSGKALALSHLQLECALKQGQAKLRSEKSA